MDIIIPTTGKRITQLEECIISLTKQTLQINIVVVLGIQCFEISRRVKELCEKYKCTLLYEPYKKVKGSHRAIACNYGLQNTNDDIVAFVDDDVTVPSTWAETATPYFEDSNIAGVTTGCKQQNSPFHLVQTIGSSSHAKDFSKVVKVESLPGYNSIYRRRALDLAGGFSEEIGGCEDWELNYRLRKAGWKLYGIPEAPVEHSHSYTWQSFIEQMFGYGWSRSRLLRKKHIFTLQHALPTIGLFVLPLLFLNFEVLTFIIGAYISTLMFHAIYIGAQNLRSFIQTVLTFMVMHVSWALGYLEGLIC